MAVGTTPRPAADAELPTAAAMAVNTFQDTMLPAALVTVVAPFHNPTPPVEFTRSPRKPAGVMLLAALPSVVGEMAVLSCCMAAGSWSTSWDNPAWPVAAGAATPVPCGPVGADSGVSCAAAADAAR